MTERELIATSVIRQLQYQNRTLLKCFLESLIANLFLIGALVAVILR
mgnify:CR=1 FL=1